MSLNRIVFPHKKYTVLLSVIIVYLREADEKVQKKQIENGQKLEEGITSWRNEVASELEKLITEDGKMQECRHNLQITIQNIDRQLHIAQECLYHRESRGGTLLCIGI